MKKLYKYELGFCDADTGQVYDRGTVELTSEELADAIGNPDWDWVELDEGPLRLSDSEAWINYYCAPDGEEMDASELLEADNEELICAGSVSTEMRELQLADLKRQYAEAISDGLSRYWGAYLQGEPTPDEYVYYEPDNNRVVVGTYGPGVIKIQLIADIVANNDNTPDDDFDVVGAKLANVWWKEVEEKILDALDNWEF